MSVTVTSHVIHLPACQGISVNPSSRFSSDHPRPTGPLTAEMLALANNVIQSVMVSAGAVSARETMCAFRVDLGTERALMWITMPGPDRFGIQAQPARLLLLLLLIQLL